MGSTKDMIGWHGGMLTVVRLAQSPFAGAHWLCRCDCGSELVVSGKNLRKGQRGCGCVNHGARTHGKSESRTYRVWVDMRRRCSDPLRPEFQNYGARGIRVCDRWQKFENFHADMGDAPEGLSIERKDNNGPYSPDNCCWATRLTQSQNRRSVRFLEINGERLCIAEAARRFGVGNTTIMYRLSVGKSALQAVGLVP